MTGHEQLAREKHELVGAFEAAAEFQETPAGIVRERLGRERFERGELFAEIVDELRMRRRGDRAKPAQDPPCFRGQADFHLVEIADEMAEVARRGCPG